MSKRKNKKHNSEEQIVTIKLQADPKKVENWTKMANALCISRNEYLLDIIESNLELRCRMGHPTSPQEFLKFASDEKYSTQKELISKIDSLNSDISNLRDHINSLTLDS
jgi:hypothetical protein